MSVALYGFRVKSLKSTGFLISLKNIFVQVLIRNFSHRDATNQNHNIIESSHEIKNISHRRATRAQTSLHKFTDSPAPLLFAYIVQYGCR